MSDDSFTIWFHNVEFCTVEKRVWSVSAWVRVLNADTALVDIENATAPGCHDFVERSFSEYIGRNEFRRLEEKLIGLARLEGRRTRRVSRELLS